MAGHSKWANIKHKKERADKKKGKIFSRIAKEIICAVRQGGKDPKSNFKLKTAIQKAKEYNFPSENIERNIKKAESKDQENYLELTYEIYGHGKVGILIDAMTDNKNRTASNIRIAINKCGGKLATPGSVAFNFEKKGILLIKKKDVIEDDLLVIVAENDCEDFDETKKNYIVVTSPEKLFEVKEKIEEKKIPIESFSLETISKNLIECSKEDIEKNQKLISFLENIDDVDVVYHNMDLKENS